MTVDTCQEPLGQPQGQENAAASELAASAAQLSLLMQKLIANRSQTDTRQDERAPLASPQLRSEQAVGNLSSVLQREAPDSVSNSTAAAHEGPQRTPDREVAQQQPASQAVATPGMTSLAAQARELLQEIEAAAAGSPAAMQAASPQFTHLEAVTARRVLAYPPDQQLFRRAVQSNDGLPQQAADTACEQLGSRTTDGASCVGDTLLSTQHLANPNTELPGTSMSLADSNTWSIALQQYQLHQQQLAALPQQALPADSCNSSNKPSAAATAADSSLVNDVSSAAPSQGLTCTTEAAGMQRELHAIAPAATSPAQLLAARLAAAGSILQPSVTAADTITSMPQRTQRLSHAVGAAGGGFSSAQQSFEERLSPDGVRLRVKALRGPLEDAMRCFSELQEAREEVSLLRARNSRLTAAEESWQADRSYLLAERKLQAAQLRQLTVLLAADAGTSTCAVISAQETAQQQVTDAQQQLENHWRLLPTESTLKHMSGPSHMTHDFTRITTEVQAAISRRQQQVDQLTQRLKDTHAELLQQQHQTEQLQHQLIAVRQAADVAAQQEVAAVQSRNEKKLLRVEQKLLKLAQAHQSTVAEFQQQLQQHQDQASTEQQQHQRLHEEQQAIQQRMETLEEQRDHLQEKLQAEKEALKASAKQVTCLQAEQQELLAAVSALESSLADAQQSAEEQQVLRHRLEDAMQAKALAVMEAKQELRDVKLVAQSAQAEVQQLQELLGALKSKAADTARQLSAARTAVHDAQQDLSAEQQHAQRQASLMEELRTELDKARRATAIAQKAQAAEVRRAEAAESAATAAFQAELSAARDAAAKAETALLDSRKEHKRLQQQHQVLQQQCKSLQEQCELLEQQLADRAAEHQQTIAQNRHDLETMQYRAEAAEADLTAIRQEIGGWAVMHSREHSELQETRAKLAETSTDLGVAMQQAAACGRQVRLNNSSRAGHNRDGSSCAAVNGIDHGKASDILSPARGRAQEAHIGRQWLGRDHSSGLQMQQLPVEVAKQLEWQAAEVLRSQNLVHQLQIQLQGTKQQLGSSQDELCKLRKQLEAAEDAVAWHQRQQQGRDEAAAARSVQLQQQQRVVQLEQELAAADGRIAELTSQLSAARAEVILQQRKHAADVMLLQELQEQLAAAEAAGLEAQKQLQELQGLQWQDQTRCHSQQPQRRQRQPNSGQWRHSEGPAMQEWQRQQRDSVRLQHSCSTSSSSSEEAKDEEDRWMNRNKHHASAQQLPQSLLSLPQQKRQQQQPVGTKVKVPSLCVRSSAGVATAAADQLAHAAETYAALVAGHASQAAAHIQAAEAATNPVAMEGTRGYNAGTPGKNQASAAGHSSAPYAAAADQEGGMFGEVLTRKSGICGNDKSLSSTMLNKAAHGRRPVAHPRPAATTAAAMRSKMGRKQRPASGAGPRVARERSTSSCISSRRQSSSAGQLPKQSWISRPSSARSLTTQPSQSGSHDGSADLVLSAPAWEDSKHGSEQWEVATASSIDYHGAIAAATAALDAAASSMPRV